MAFSGVSYVLLPFCSVILYSNTTCFFKTTSGGILISITRRPAINKMKHWAVITFDLSQSMIYVFELNIRKCKLIKGDSLIDKIYKCFSFYYIMNDLYHVLFSREFCLNYVVHFTLYCASIVHRCSVANWFNLFSCIQIIWRGKSEALQCASTIF